MKQTFIQSQKMDGKERKVWNTFHEKGGNLLKEEKGEINLNVRKIIKSGLGIAGAYVGGRSGLSTLSAVHQGESFTAALKMNVINALTAVKDFILYSGWFFPAIGALYLGISMARIVKNAFMPLINKTRMRKMAEQELKNTSNKKKIKELEKVIEQNKLKKGELLSAIGSVLFSVSTWWNVIVGALLWQGGELINNYRDILNANSWSDRIDKFVVTAPLAAYAFLGGVAAISAGALVSQLIVPGGALIIQVIKKIIPASWETKIMEEYEKMVGWIKTKTREIWDNLKNKFTEQLTQDHDPQLLPTVEDGRQTED